MKKNIVIVEAEPSSRGSGSWMDDLAYLLPMGVFLALTFAGGHWEKFFPASYVLKTLVVAGLLIALRRHFTRINWSYAWLGALVGALVFVQWVGMESLLLKFWPNYPRMSRGPVLDPFEKFAAPWQAWAFILIRWAGASLVVPFMEELFWRDYLWRSIISPSDFKLARVGEWDALAFFGVAVAFGAGVHIEWMTAVVCGLIFGGLLLYTRSLGACIIAHAVTNFLLGGYVLLYKDWKFW